MNEARDWETYETWRAEVWTRLGRPNRAVAVYEWLAERSADPAVALDAAETLLDAGFDAHARQLARIALDLAEASDDGPAIERAKEILFG